MWNVAGGICILVCAGKFSTVVDYGERRTFPPKEKFQPKLRPQLERDYPFYQWTIQIKYPCSNLRPQLLKLLMFLIPGEDCHIFTFNTHFKFLTVCVRNECRVTEIIYPQVVHLHVAFQKRFSMHQGPLLLKDSGIIMRLNKWWQRISAMTVYLYSATTLWQYL